MFRNNQSTVWFFVRFDLQFKTILLKQKKKYYLKQRHFFRLQFKCIVHRSFLANLVDRTNCNGWKWNLWNWMIDTFEWCECGLRDESIKCKYEYIACCGQRTYLNHIPKQPVCKQQILNLSTPNHTENQPPYRPRLKRVASELIAYLLLKRCKAMLS